MALTMPSGFSLRSLQRKYGLLQYMTGLNLYMQFPMSASFPLITVCNGLTSTSSGVLKRIDIAMEESKELQGFYRIFRAVVYVSVLMEFFEYCQHPGPCWDHWGGILCDIHGRIKTVGHL